MPGLNTLKTKYAQVYDNFEKDFHVNTIKIGSQTLKDIFYAEIDKISDGPDFEQNANASCYPYKLKGPLYKPALGDEVGGTALPLGLFIKDLVLEIEDYLKRNPGIGLATVSELHVRKLFLDAGQKGDFKGLRFFIKGYGIDNVTLRRNFGIMWSYINERDRTEIFHSMSKEEISTLPCILGLDPDTFGEVYICFGHLLNSNFVDPTAMDAGMFKFWRPGGKTNPLDTCNTYNARTEVVHKPAMISRLKNQIEIIQKVRS